MSAATCPLSPPNSLTVAPAATTRSGLCRGRPGPMRVTDTWSSSCGCRRPGRRSAGWPWAARGRRPEGAGRSARRGSGRGPGVDGEVLDLASGSIPSSCNPVDTRTAEPGWVQDDLRCLAAEVPSGGDMSEQQDHVPGAVVRITEIVGSSPNSFSDAMRNAVRAAAETVRGIRGVEVISSNADVDENGNLSLYKVNCKIAFVVERSAT